MDQHDETMKSELSGEVADWVKELRQKHYEELAKVHDLTVEEIQSIHESTLGRLTGVEPKFQMYIGIALPKAIDEYKRDKAIE